MLRMPPHSEQRPRGGCKLSPLGPDPVHPLDGNVAGVFSVRAVRGSRKASQWKSRLLGVEGTWQREPTSGGRVRHLVARRVHDLTPLLGRLAGAHGASRDFH